METRRSRNDLTLHRKPRKLRRLLFVAVVLLLGAYGIIWLNTGPATTPQATKTNSSRTPLPKNAALAWPAVGYAAVGSVEDGLLASSSQDQTPRPTASMAKVITALAIMKKQPFKPGETGQTYTINAQDVANYKAYVASDGSTVPVSEGMVLTQYQALQAMLIASGNNIADTLVDRVFGSMDAYTAYAQNMLKYIGVNRTVVDDASGFSSDTVSTPSEMVLIGIAALEDPVIADIVSQQYAEIPEVGRIKNTNELLSTDDAVGIKTGTTDEAGSCLLFAKRYNTTDKQKATIVSVIMGDASRTRLYADSRTLLTSARQAFNLTEAQPADPETAPRQQSGTERRSR